MLSQTLSLVPAQAQQAGMTQLGNFQVPSTMISQAIPEIPRADTGSTILPTDVVPLPAAEQRMTMGENLQLRILQRLPARSYFNVSCEVSIRDETNPFQDPNKRNFIKRFLPPPPQFRELPILRQISLLHEVSNVDINNAVWRILPNVTAGWTLTPRTRIYGNWFLIRDQLEHSAPLDTTINSVSYGIQQDVPVGKRGNLQGEFQVRSLYQTNQKPIYDFLPAVTFSYILTPRTVVFANSLLQMRGHGYYQPATIELDPFYTFGGLYQKGAFSYSANATLVTNYRQLFGKRALIDQDNYSWILDFEIAKRLFKQMPGLQAFFRYEPIYNFHSKDTPGLAGVDMRFFWGLRVAMGKPPLTAALNQIREQLEEQEVPPPPPPEQAPGEKPSAWRAPAAEIASLREPIHGYLTNIAQLPSSVQEEPSTLSSMHGIALDTTLIAATSQGSDLMPSSLAYATIAQELEKGRERIIIADSANFAMPLPAPEQAKSHLSNTRLVALTTPAWQIPTFIHQPEKAMQMPTVKSKTVAHHQATSQTHKPASPHQTFFVHNQTPMPTKIAVADESQVGQSKPRNSNYELSETQEKSDELPPLKLGLTNPPRQHTRPRIALRSEVSDKSAQIKMVIMPPLPVVKPNSKDNPFPEAQENLTPPIMMNTVH